MKRLLSIVYSIIFLTACQSVTVGNEAEVQKTYIKGVIEKSCFSHPTGTFLANVSDNHNPSATWEGKWTENYNKLKTQVLNPLGLVIAVNPVTEMMSEFGPHGLRTAMCGQMAFLQSLLLNKHEILIKSTMNIEHKLNGQSILETTTEFYYGLFAKKNKDVLFWRGIIENDTIKPELIRFGAGKEFLLIDFIDYE